MSKFLCPYFKYCLRFLPLVSATVLKDVGRVCDGGELVLVVSLELDGVVVAPGGGVIPGGRIDAGVGEVLVGLVAQQPQEGELDRTQ